MLSGKGKGNINGNGNISGKTRFNLLSPRSSISKGIEYSSLSNFSQSGKPHNALSMSQDTLPITTRGSALDRYSNAKVTKVAPGK